MRAHKAPGEAGEVDNRTHHALAAAGGGIIKAAALCPCCRSARWDINAFMVRVMDIKWRNRLEEDFNYPAALPKPPLSPPSAR
eukprot:576107-Prorocentrum_minimum.AAC.1